MEVYIIGNGGLSSEITSMCIRNNIKVNGYCVTDEKYRTKNTLLLLDIPVNSNVICAIGNPNSMQNIYENYPNLNYVNLIDSDSIIYNSGFIIDSDGIVISPLSIISNNVRIGNLTSINMMVTIGHDSVIGSYNYICPHVSISGNVTIGDRCYIGSSASIKNGISICDDVIIGMGAVVVKDIDIAGTYVGNPARRKI